jgi:hypothetical protein
MRSRKLGEQLSVRNELDMVYVALGVNYVALRFSLRSSLNTRLQTDRGGETLSLSQRK